MSVLSDNNTKLLVQGITGSQGMLHTRGCRDYGTNIVAGVTPGKGGQEFEGVPIFNTVQDAVKATGANASMILVPPPFAADAIMEAADAEIPLIVAIASSSEMQRAFKISTSDTNFATLRSTLAWRERYLLWRTN